LNVPLWSSLGLVVWSNSSSMIPAEPPTAPTGKPLPRLSNANIRMMKNTLTTITLIMLLAALAACTTTGGPSDEEILLAAGATVYLFARYRQTPKGREVYDRFLLRIPVFGRLIMLGIVIRFTRTLSTLLSSGVSLLKAMDILTAVVDNTVFANAIASARESVTEGASLSQPLKQSGIFPPIVIHMVASGEQSGELEEMLAKVAEIYEEEADTLASTLMSLLEPVLILGMAVVVAFIVISILLPLLEINQIVR